MKPERPLRSLDIFYHGVMNVFTGTGITDILYDCVNVSNASCAQFPGISLLYNLIFLFICSLIF